MTEPIRPVDAALTAVQGVEQVRANADALQLTWGVRFARVVNVNALDPTIAMVTFDDGGDTVVPAIILTGGVTADTRVAIISTPPSGLYIIAHANPAFQARQTLEASASSVTFSNIPTTLRRLEFHYTARGDTALNTFQGLVRVNGNSAAVYYSEVLVGTNATPAAGANNGTTQGPSGVATGSLAAAGVYGSGSGVFVGWDSPHSTSLGYTFTSQAIGSGVANFTTLGGGGIYLADGPYTSLTFFPQAGNYVAGSDFQLSGWPT